MSYLPIFAHFALVLIAGIGCRRACRLVPERGGLLDDDAGRSHRQGNRSTIISHGRAALVTADVWRDAAGGLANGVLSLLGCGAMTEPSNVPSRRKCRPE